MSIINRQDAIDAICAKCTIDKPALCPTRQDRDAWCEEVYILLNLPSAQKTGKWIEKGRSLGIPESVCYTCSECGNAWWNVKGDWKFCPNCGARMLKGEEDGI